MKITPLLSLSILVLAGAPVLAQDEVREKIPELKSGPAKGNPLGKVNVYAPMGPFKGKEFDATAKIGKAPGAILFVHETTRETAPIIRQIDNMAAEFGILGFKSFTVLLEGDRTSGEEQVQRFSKALKLRNPIVLTLDGAEGPGAFALNRTCTLTLVMCKGGRVHKSIALKDTGQKDVKLLRAAIVEVAGKMPANEAEFQEQLPNDARALKKIIFQLTQELKRAQQQMEQQRNRQRNRRGRNQRGRNQRGGRNERGGQGRGPTSRPNKKLPGAAPTDGELLRLLRAAIQKDNTAKDLDRVFAKVDARVGKDAALQTQAVEMFKRMLGVGYGTADAKKRAQAYIRKHGGL